WARSAGSGSGSAGRRCSRDRGVCSPGPRGGRAVSIPVTVIEAAARAAYGVACVQSDAEGAPLLAWDPGHGPRETVLIEQMTAAAPLIEAAVREQIAREIEGVIPGAEARIEGWITRNRPDQVVKYRVVIE